MTGRIAGDLVDVVAVEHLETDGVADRAVAGLHPSVAVGDHAHPKLGTDDFIAGKRDLRLVMKPGARESIDRISATRDFLLVSVLNNVRGELRRYHHAKSATGVPKACTVKAADWPAAMDCGTGCTARLGGPTVKTVPAR